MMDYEKARSLLGSLITPAQDAPYEQDWDDDAKAIMSAVNAEVAKQMNWQPIETAPKDGTWILGINNRGNQAVIIWDSSAPNGFGEYGPGWIHPFTDGRRSSFWNGGCGSVATHWMPLPPERAHSAGATDGIAGGTSEGDGMMDEQAALRKIDRLRTQAEPCLFDMLREIGDAARFAQEAIAREDMAAAKAWVGVIQFTCKGTA